MGKTPVVFREPGVDPSMDEIPLRSVSMRPLLTCGAILFVVGLLACGGLMFVSAQMGSKPTPAATIAPSDTATPTPDHWEATGTAIAGWTPTATPTDTATPTETPTATYTLDAWDRTGTAIFWQTYTPTHTLTPSPTYTPSPRPTHSGPNLFYQWGQALQATAQAARTQAWLNATVTAQGWTPTPEAVSGTPQIQYVEVTRMVSGGGGSAPAAPDVQYVEVTRVVGGGQPPAPTAWIVPLPSPNPTYYVWLTWTPTPTIPGITPTASLTATHTPSATMTLQPSSTPTASPTDPPSSTPIPSETPTASPTSTQTATETPQAESTDVPT